VQKEREFYEVIIEDKKMMYKLSRKIVDTSEGPKDAKWIFVLSTTKVLYIGSVKNSSICQLSIVLHKYLNHKIYLQLMK
jgi:hypothetical protein